jgi:uncharacterized integral membrane protein
MLSILFSAILGLAIGYFALQNATPVTIQVGELVFQEVPLYLVAVGSLIVGILVASMLYLARTVSANMHVHGRPQPATTDKTVAALERRIHDLEIENTRLKASHDSHVRDTEYRAPALTS